ncbi:MAG: PepSY domain-containing protein, partial [Oscillospiraceae bacterium]|nr:PepSY domain-containing protein [Oscillospiraceae bacterium]
MKDQELERRIRTAMEHAAPDRLDSILSSCDEQKGEYTNMTTLSNFSNTTPRPDAEKSAPAKRSVWRRFAAIAAALVLFVGIGSYSMGRRAAAVDSIILLDVNPSISISVNANEKVLSAEALNADAETVLGNMDLKGVSLDVAVNAIIGAMLQAGYLDEARNSILVSVESGDAARGAALEQEVSAAIAAATQTDSLSAAVLSQTISATDETLTSLAAEYDISLGKAALIQEVVAQDATLTVADLAGVDINEIALLISSNNISTSTTQTGTASDKAYIGESAALNAALVDAGVSNADVLRSTAKLGRENGVMVYEVEFDTAEMEYDYDIDAGTGAVVSVDIERRYSGLETVISSITSGTLIGETAAEDIALADAG